MQHESQDIEILVSVEFQQSLRKLAKKYRNIRSDIESLIQVLQRGEFIGDRIQGLGNVVVFKVRVQNSDAQRGKSGGYRIIYELRLPSLVALLQIYSKSE